MQVFNVGVLELLFILIIAFIVLGPKRTITTARDFGRWVRNLAKSPIWRDIVSTSSEIRDLPRKMIDDAELQKLITELDLSTQEVKEILTQTQMETNVELAKLEEEINQELQETPSVGEVDDPSIDSE
jgi:Sec-independent protein translocase protein TatA